MGKSLWKDVFVVLTITIVAAGLKLWGKANLSWFSISMGFIMPIVLTGIAFLIVYFPEIIKKFK